MKFEALPFVLIAILWVLVVGMYVFKPCHNLCVVDHPGYSAIGVCYGVTYVSGR